MDTHLELLEPSALVSAEFPPPFHTLDSDKTLIRILRPCADGGLHRRYGRIGGKGTMPIAEPDRSKGTIAESLDECKGAY